MLCEVVLNYILVGCPCCRNSYLESVCYAVVKYIKDQFISSHVLFPPYMLFNSSETSQHPVLL